MASASPSLLSRIDTQLDSLLHSWNIYTTVIAIALVLYLLYPLFTAIEPDTHPFLLARQSTAFRVRQPGESAVYRALDVPHGYPLRSGLNVKDAGTPKWTAGRDGDLRDVWRRASLGVLGEGGKYDGKVGKILTVLGQEEVVGTGWEVLSRELNAVGKHLQQHGGMRIAIYLSNSTELLVTLFASTFYDITPILIPFEPNLENLAAVLRKVNADTLVVGAGSVPLSELVTLYQGLKQVVWVVPKSSRHLDWNEVPEGAGGKAEVSVWHDIVDEAGSFASSDLPAMKPGSNATDIIIVAQSGDESGINEITQMTQKNLVAGISAQIAALPRLHHWSSSDLILPLTPLTDCYSLTITLAALFSNASLALTSVTGPLANYKSAFTGLSPTIIIADPVTLYRFEEEQRKSRGNGFFQAQRHGSLIEQLSQGSMPAAKALNGQASPRLIYTYDVSRPGPLNNLRVYTGARVIVGLTDPRVVGAVSQTNMLDYQGLSHFGPPLSCLEIKLMEVPGKSIDGDEPEGQLQVAGPAVVGGEAVVEGKLFKITECNTLAYSAPFTIK